MNEQDQDLVLNEVVRQIREAIDQDKPRVKTICWKCGKPIERSEGFQMSGFACHHLVCPIG